ncbi:MAG: hypothetical protein L6R37_008251 [Teloschistes peruensis]|nr:MAG: hypothetical protein L6R37_008251 [Teloschistes peruensis]
MFDSYQRRIKDKLPPQLLQTLRVLQFLAAIVSIILYIVYIVRKATTTSSDGAILGITAGAIVWTVIALGKACFAKRKIVILVLLAVILDIAFVGAYIAIVALTGGAATGSCGRRQGDDDDDNSDSDSANGSITNCNLKKGVFALAIINM